MSNGSGVLVYDGTNLAGQLTATVAVAIPGVTLSGTLQVQINTGMTAVTETITNATGPDGATAAVLGDVNGDGRPDLIVGSSDGQTLLYLNQGGATPFNGTPITLTASGSGDVSALALADLNGDGPPDLIIGNSTGATEVLLGDGKGGFTPAPAPVASAATAGDTTAPGNDVTALLVADVNGDGRPDVITVESGKVYLYLNAGADPTTAAWNGFQGRAPLGTPTTASSIALGDVNGDGAPDLVIGDSSGNTELLTNIAPPPPTSDPRSDSGVHAGELAGPRLERDGGRGRRCQRRRIRRRDRNPERVGVPLPEQRRERDHEDVERDVCGGQPDRHLYDRRDRGARRRQRRRPPRSGAHNLGGRRVDRARTRRRYASLPPRRERSRRRAA